MPDRESTTEFYAIADEFDGSNGLIFRDKQTAIAYMHARLDYYNVTDEAEREKEIQEFVKPMCYRTEAPRVWDLWTIISPYQGTPTVAAHRVLQTEDEVKESLEKRELFATEEEAKAFLPRLIEHKAKSQEVDAWWRKEYAALEDERQRRLAAIPL